MNDALRKPLKGRRVAILGSSVAGIAAAISLSVQGARVVVLEEERQLVPEWRQRAVGPYRFDPWPPFVMTPARLADLFDTAEFRLTDFLNLEREEIVGEFRFPNSDPVVFHSSEEAFRDELARIDKEDARRFHALIRRCRRFWGVQQAVLSGNIPPSKLRFLHPRALPFAHALLDPRGGQPYGQRPFRSPEIRRIIAALSAVLGVRIYRDPALALGRLYELFHFGAWKIEGGGEALRQALTRLAREQNVRFIRNVHVDRIDLQNGRVRRISGAGFKPFAVSLAISTWTHKRTAECFADGLENKNARPADAEFMLHVGAEAEWNEMSRLTILPGDDPLEDSRMQDQWGIPSANSTLCVYTGSKAPSGHTPLTLRMSVPAPNYRFTWTEDHQQDFERKLYSRCEAVGYDDMSYAIEEKSVIVPDASITDPAEKFRWHAFHRPRLPMNTLLRYDPRTSVPGLYQAEAVPFHGTDLTGSIQSGINAAEAAVRDA